MLELLNFDPTKALEHANRGIALDRELIAAHPTEPSLKQALGSLTAAAAGAYRGLGELEKSADAYRESINAREELMRVDPNDSALRRNLLIAYGNYSMLLGVPWSPNLGRTEEARVNAAKGVELARQMVAADPNNATARHDLGMILSRLGMIDPGPNGAGESLKSLEEARSLIDPILAANPQNAETANQVAAISRVSRVTANNARPKMPRQQQPTSAASLLLEPIFRREERHSNGRVHRDPNEAGRCRRVNRRRRHCTLPGWFEETPDSRRPSSSSRLRRSPTSTLPVWLQRGRIWRQCRPG